MSPFRFAAFALAVGLTSVQLRAEPISFTGLGDLGGGAFSSLATAVSANGLFVTGYSTSTTYNPAGGDEGFRWAAGVLTGLGAPLAMPTTESFSRPVGIDATGTRICGEARGVFFPSSFCWNNGVMGNPASDELRVNAVSANGITVGMTFFGPLTQAYRHGAVLPLLPGAPIVNGWSEAFSVSEDGNVVVGESNYTANQSSRQAFRWTSATSTQPLGFLPGMSSSVARLISGDGNTIWGSSGQAFLWTQATGMQPNPLGTPTSSSFDGSVLLYGSNIWDQANGFRSIRDILTGAGINMNGWGTLSGTDISADGSVVVGYAVNPNGNTEAFRAVVPEPAAGAILLIGAACTLNRFRRNRAWY